MIAKTLFNRAPLMPGRFAPLPLGALRPRGWLLRQLQLQAQGLTGRLPEVLPDVGDDCAWLGGPGPANAHAARYLDGLVPLAFLLDDDALKEEAVRRVEWVMESQREDGSFGPEMKDAFIARGVMLKAVWQYYTATAERRALLFLLRYLKFLLYDLSDHALSSEEAACAADTLYVALNVYNVTGKRPLLDLCQLLCDQGKDWTRFCHTFPYRIPMYKHTPPAQMKQLLQQEDDERSYYAHLQRTTRAATIAQGLRMPALSYVLTGSGKHEEAFETGMAKLMKAHGTACGCFTGDTLLAGANPSQGVDARAVQELMFSLETVLWAQGTPDAADALERLAFNALPASFTADMRACQCVQQPNQVRVSREERAFYDAGDGANLFTAHEDARVLSGVHQGFPKFAASLWMLSRDGGLAAMSYAPCTLRYRLGETAVRLSVESAYPYDGAVKITLSLSQDAAFPLHLHIPAWAEGATAAVEGEVVPCAPGEFAVLTRQWHDGDVVLLNLPMSARLTRWYHASAAVERGPLVFALPCEEEWIALCDRPLSPDWAVSAKSAWNYALVSGAGFDESAQPDQAGPFGEGCPIELETDAVAVPDWGMQGASCDQPPIAPPVSPEDAVRVRLIPYGAAALRISQFPVA